MPHQLTLTIPGRVPSKKNSRRLICRGKSPISLPSLAYRAWHEEQMWRLTLWKQTSLFHDPLRHCAVRITLYFPNDQAADLSNKAESIMDLLVDAGVIEDDRWQVVHGLTLEGFMDRKEPRAEIEISTVDSFINEQKA